MSVDLSKIATDVQELERQKWEEQCKLESISNTNLIINEFEQNKDYIREIAERGQRRCLIPISQNAYSRLQSCFKRSIFNRHRYSSNFHDQEINIKLKSLFGERCKLESRNEWYVFNGEVSW
jgi:hypothetical protein